MTRLWAIVSAADRDPVPSHRARLGLGPGALRFRRYPWPSAEAEP